MTSRSSRLPRSIPLRLEDFLERDRVALLMWDMQNGLAGRSPMVDTVRRNSLELLASADRLEIPVIWSRHVLPDPDLISGPFQLFLMKKQNVDHPDKLTPSMQEGGDDVAFIDGMAPKSTHLVLEKSQPSLFVDTPLEMRMKALGVDTLVIAGVATDIGVEFNCRHAAALGYYTVVAEDATASYQAEAHERSLAFLRDWTTPVVTTARICSVWDAQARTGVRGL